MISDKLNTFLDVTALSTAAPASVAIGDVIDLGDVRRLQETPDLRWVVLMDVLPTSAGAATVAFELITSANSDMTSSDVVVSTPVRAIATLVAGFVAADISVPTNFAYKRYLGVRQVTAAFALTAGAATSMLNHGASSYRSFADGILPGTG